MSRIAEYYTDIIEIGVLSELEKSGVDDGFFSDYEIVMIQETCIEKCFGLTAFDKIEWLKIIMVEIAAAVERKEGR